MTAAPTYAAACQVCEWTATGPTADRDAERHGKDQPGHATTTHVAGGPYDKGRKA